MVVTARRLQLEISDTQRLKFYTEKLNKITLYQYTENIFEKHTKKTEAKKV